MRVISQDVVAALKPWSNFFAVTASATATLTGLVFVVVTLINRIDPARTKNGLRIFTTPTVLNFAAALFVSAVLVMPWPSLVVPAVVLGIAGVGGVAHLIDVMVHTRRLGTFDPDLEDWLAYTLLPLVAYVTLTGGAIALPRAPGGALYAIAFGALLLVFIGIRNAWDLVTFLVIRGAEGPADAPDRT